MIGRKKKQQSWRMIACMAPLSLAACQLPGALSPETASHNFGEVLIGDSVQSPELVWRNTGNVTEKVVGQVTLPPGGAFKEGKALPRSLLIIRPGARTPPVTFVFTPQDGGPASGEGSLRVTALGDSPDRAPTVKLKGVGRFRVARQGINFLDLAANTDAPLDFGPANVEADPVVQTLEIMNVSPEPIEASLALRRGDQGFTVIYGSEQILLPTREKVVVEMQFAPVDVGRYTDVVSLTEVASGERVAAAIVVGEGFSEE